jgi:hypothetical protein
MVDGTLSKQLEMTRLPKQKDDAAPVESDERSTWGDDQKLREYYYDDAHGYQNFDPDAELDEEEEDERDENDIKGESSRT